MSVVLVKFLSAYHAYNRGEVASFTPEEAAVLVEVKRVGVYTSFEAIEAAKEAVEAPEPAPEAEAVEPAKRGRKPKAEEVEAD